MSNTKITKCNCAHAYQDSVYGTGNRVRNATMVKGKIAGWRCTICRDKKALSSGEGATEKVVEKVKEVVGKK